MGSIAVLLCAQRISCCLSLLLCYVVLASCGSEGRLLLSCPVIVAHTDSVVVVLSTGVQLNWKWSIGHKHTHTLTHNQFISYTPSAFGWGYRILCVGVFSLDRFSVKPRGECVSAPVRPLCPGMAWTGMSVPLIPVGTCYSRAQRTWADTCNEKAHKHQSPNTSTFWTQVSIGVPKSCSFLNVREQISFELKIVLLSAEECWNKCLYSFLSWRFTICKAVRSQTGICTLKNSWNGLTNAMF